MTGGNIRNAVVAAAFAAADRPWFRFVTMADVLLGVRREFQKLGQLMSDRELGLDQFKLPPTAPKYDKPGHNCHPVMQSLTVEDTVEVGGEA